MASRKPIDPPRTGRVRVVRDRRALVEAHQPPVVVADPGRAAAAADRDRRRGRWRPCRRWPASTPGASSAQLERLDRDRVVGWLRVERLEDLGARPSASARADLEEVGREHGLVAAGDRGLVAAREGELEGEQRRPHRAWPRRGRGRLADRDLQLELVAERDPVRAGLGDGRLDRGARAVHGTRVDPREPEPAPLVEAERIDVVVRGHEPEPARRRTPRRPAAPRR